MAGRPRIFSRLMLDIKILDVRISEGGRADDKADGDVAEGLLLLLFLPPW